MNLPPPSSFPILLPTLATWQFLVLREDSLAPLRLGISSFRKKEPLDDRQVHLYVEVELLSLKCARASIIYRIAFQPVGKVDWQRTQRLVLGSLLALSCDNFETIIWAIVAARDPDLLGGGQPQIDIFEPRRECVSTAL